MIFENSSPRYFQQCRLYSTYLAGKLNFTDFCANAEEMITTNTTGNSSEEYDYGKYRELPYHWFLLTTLAYYALR